MSSSSPSIRANTLVAGYMMKMPPLVDKRAVAEQICQTCSGPIYSQGLETFQVPSKFEVCLEVYMIQYSFIIYDTLSLCLNFLCSGII